MVRFFPQEVHTDIPATAVATEAELLIEHLQMQWVLLVPIYSLVYATKARGYASRYYDDLQSSIN